MRQQLLRKMENVYVSIYRLNNFPFSLGSENFVGLNFDKISVNIIFKPVNCVIDSNVRFDSESIFSGFLSLTEFCFSF